MEHSRLRPRRLYQQVEVRNVLDVLIYVDHRIMSRELPVITSEMICDLNRRTLEGSEHEPQVAAGKLRHYSSVWRATEGLLQR